MWDKIKRGVRRAPALAVAMGLMLMGSTAFAVHDDPLVEHQTHLSQIDIGFDVDEAITALSTTLGASLGGIVLVAFALYAINYGVRKTRSYTGATK